MRTKFEREIYLFLSLYRFFSYGLAVILIQVVPRDTALGLETYLLLVTIGLYTLLKILGPLRWWERDPTTYVVLGGDILVCLLALLLTGGLTSAFLLYSSLPVITAALLFQERMALIIAAVSAAVLALAHIVFSRWTDQFAWVMEGNLLQWLVFYAIGNFLIATVVYRTNLNIRQRIEQGAVLEERRRMRRELHDGVAQALSYISLKGDSVSKLVAQQQTAQALKGMEDMRKAVEESHKSIRESLDHLSIEVGTVPLSEAMEEMLRQFEERTGVRGRLEVCRPAPRLSPVAEIQLLRITQEALVNVRKHAQATEVQVSLRNSAEGVQLDIKDNGRGLQVIPPSSGDDSGGHGLKVMRERAEGLGGHLTIVSAPGGGTEVRVLLPRERGLTWKR